LRYTISLPELIKGHYGCGGCSAALGHTDLGLIDNWLRHLRDIHSLHSTELDAISDMEERTNRLVELKYILLRVLLMVVFMPKSIQPDESPQCKRQRRNAGWRFMDGCMMWRLDASRLLI
jgi:hypothetical protein